MIKIEVTLPTVKESKTNLDILKTKFFIGLPPGLNSEQKNGNPVTCTYITKNLKIDLTFLPNKIRKKKHYPSGYNITIHISYNVWYILSYYT